MPTTTTEFDVAKAQKIAGLLASAASIRNTVAGMHSGFEQAHFLKLEKRLWDVALAETEELLGEKVNYE